MTRRTRLLAGLDLLAMSGALVLCVFLQTGSRRAMAQSSPATDLSGYWHDPELDPTQPAFYYVRLIEIPTPRWTAYDAKRFGIKMDPQVPMTVTNRAYTSPIWYSPTGTQETAKR